MNPTILLSVLSLQVIHVTAFTVTPSLPLVSRTNQLSVFSTALNTLSQDGEVELSPSTEHNLLHLLRHADMESEVARGVLASKARYAGIIFAPVPYSDETKYGMPRDIQKKYWLKEEYTVINIPSVTLFKAKIFDPPHLCAVYAIDGLSEEGKEKIKKEREGVERRQAPKEANLLFLDDSEISNTLQVGEVIRGAFTEKQVEDELKSIDDFNYDNYLI